LFPFPERDISRYSAGENGVSGANKTSDTAPALPRLFRFARNDPRKDFHCEERSHEAILRRGSPLAVATGSGHRSVFRATFRKRPQSYRETRHSGGMRGTNLRVV